MTKKLKNIHPGEILLEEFLTPMNISQNKLAHDIGVLPRRINEIVLGKRSITTDTDLKLSRALGTSEGFWLGLQADYDLEEPKMNKIKAICDKYDISHRKLGILTGYSRVHIQKANTNKRPIVARLALLLDSIEKGLERGDIKIPE